MARLFSCTRAITQTYGRTHPTRVHTSHDHHHRTKREPIRLRVTWRGRTHAHRDRLSTFQSAHARHNVPFALLCVPYHMRWRGRGRVREKGKKKKDSGKRGIYVHQVIDEKQLLAHTRFLNKRKKSNVQGGSEKEEERQTSFERSSRK